MNLARRKFLHLAAGAPASLLSAAAGLPAAAQTVEQFYQGKTVTVMVGSPPSGSFDRYARLAASHIKRQIPGNPNMIIEHRSGGGGFRAVSQLYAKSPRDGTVIGLLPGSNPQHAQGHYRPCQQGDGVM
jgi:tripartite-type tricarboxylate transporter receptor subunit TctC